jgi:hypothetical protein
MASQKRRIRIRIRINLGRNPRRVVGSSEEASN